MRSYFNPYRLYGLFVVVVGGFFAFPFSHWKGCVLVSRAPDVSYSKVFDSPRADVKMDSWKFSSTVLFSLLLPFEYCV